MEEQTRIKICGLTRLEDIDAVNELKPEYVGFVFAKSRRQITKEHAVTLRRDCRRIPRRGRHRFGTAPRK